MKPQERQNESIQSVISPQKEMQLFLLISLEMDEMHLSKLQNQKELADVTNLNPTLLFSALSACGDWSQMFLQVL